jgi:osmotically-inducible protein OsmY
MYSFTPILRAAVSGVILACVMSGCATYSKCGLDGCPEDAKITADVQARLQNDPDLGGLSMVQVRTLNHVVYLTGQVTDGLQRRVAGYIASETKGVARVENSISLAK